MVGIGETVFFLGAGILAWGKVIGSFIMWAAIGGLVMALESVGKRLLDKIAMIRSSCVQAPLQRERVIAS